MLLLQEYIFCHAKCSIRELGAGKNTSFTNRYECCACERSLYMNPSESSVSHVQAYHACMLHTRMCLYVSHFETRACSADMFICSFVDLRLSGRLSRSMMIAMPLMHRCTWCANGMRAPPACSQLPLHAYACTTGLHRMQTHSCLRAIEWLELRSAIPGVTSEEYIHHIAYTALYLSHVHRMFTMIQ